VRELWVVAVLAVMSVMTSACGGPAADPPGTACQAPFARGEFGSNYAVVATLSHPPAVGGTATLTVEVCAKEAARSVVSVRLRGGFEWRTPPDGTTVTRRPAPHGGCEQTAAVERDLAALTPVELVGTVVATTAGPAELGGSAEAVATDVPLPGNSAYLYVTVGADRGSSHFGYPEDDGDTSSATGTRPPPPVCD
jgi:hypothetical protein